MSARGHKRERGPPLRPASHAAGVPQLADSPWTVCVESAMGQIQTSRWTIVDGRSSSDSGKGGSPARSFLSRVCVIQPLDFFRPVDCHAKVGHQTVGERINPTVDTDCLSARPCALHNDIRRDVSHLPDDVKLAQTVEASTWLLDRIKLLTVLMEDLADRM